MALNGASSAQELQARIKELEISRKARADEAARIIASQRATIDRLRADNQRLSSDLAAVGNTDAAAFALLAAGTTPGFAKVGAGVPQAALPAHRCRRLRPGGWPRATTTVLEVPHAARFRCMQL